MSVDESRIIIKWKADQGAFGPSFQKVAGALRDIAVALDNHRGYGETGDYTWSYDED